MLADQHHGTFEQAQKATGFKWWAQRLSRAMQLYDETRIDHFRGFAGTASIVTSAQMILTVHPDQFHKSSHQVLDRVNLLRQQ